MHQQREREKWIVFDERKLRWFHWTRVILTYSSLFSTKKTKKRGSMFDCELVLFAWTEIETKKNIVRQKMINKFGFPNLTRLEKAYEKERNVQSQKNGEIGERFYRPIQKNNNNNKKRWYWISWRVIRDKYNFGSITLQLYIYYFIITFFSFNLTQTKSFLWSCPFSLFLSTLQCKSNRSNSNSEHNLPLIYYYYLVERKG